MSPSITSNFTRSAAVYPPLYSVAEEVCLFSWTEKKVEATSSFSETCTKLISSLKVCYFKSNISPIGLRGFIANELNFNAVLSGVSMSSKSIFVSK